MWTHPVAVSPLTQLHQADLPDMLERLQRRLSVVGLVRRGTAPLRALTKPRCALLLATYTLRAAGP